MKYTALAGGTGAAKFLRGLCRVLAPEDLTVIVNTGDDWVVWGLSISPDLDTVTYTLAGLIDETQGWGVRDDTFRCLAVMAALGRETWFNLGDKDLATHLYRTDRLREGNTLSQVTDEIRRRFGIRSRILPMSDQRVATRVLTPDGWLAFQEFFVREKGQLEVQDVAYERSESAGPAPGVVEAISQAAAVIVCPSNPISSIGPILAIRGIQDTLAATRAPIVAVSPIVGGGPVSGPAGKMMLAKGLPVSPVGVAQAYEKWLDILVLDRQDSALASEVQALGIRAVVTDTIMRDRQTEVSLARAVVRALS
jgi:LPPG:FO 2-phospho-L-lactate transferase